MPWSSKQVSFLAICRPISCKHFWSLHHNYNVK
jgi:hypothetical protein